MINPGPRHIFRPLLDYYVAFVILIGLTSAFFVVSFDRFYVFFVSSYSLQDQSQLITLRVGMGKSKNMAKNGRKVTRKGRLFLNPRGSVHSKRAVQNLDVRPKSHENAQVIVHNGVARGHTAVFDTGPHQ